MGATIQPMCWGVAAVMLACAGATLAFADGGEVERRKRAILEGWAWQPPALEHHNPRVRFARQAARALALYSLDNRELAPGVWSHAVADGHVLDLATNPGIPDDPHINDPDRGVLYHFVLEMPLLTRLWVDPTLRGRMGPEAREALLGMMWTHMNTRSVAAQGGDGFAEVWTWNSSAGLSGLSENKIYALRSCFYLQARALMEEDGYGPDRRLADGETLRTHYEAWRDNLRERFRQNAREGVFQETASPNYLKVSLCGIYNLRDFADPVTARLAGRFLDLVFADEAHDFQHRAGISGASVTRVHERHDLLPQRHGMAATYYMYAWHDLEPLAQNVNNWQGSDGRVNRPAAHILTAAASDYVPPDMLRAMARDTDKSPYFYRSRRWGRFDADLGHALPSHILRTTWWTPDYTLGAMTYDPTKRYTALHRSSQAFGVLCNTANVSGGTVTLNRLFVHAVDREFSGGYYNPRQALTGVVGRDVLVAQRDPDHRDADTLAVLFTAGDLEDHFHHDEASGWSFTRSGGALIAVRVAGGGFTIDPDLPAGEGRRLLLDADPDSPIVVQVARASDYENFDRPMVAFMMRVRERPLRYRDGVMSYTSLAGDEYETRAGGRDVPRINGRAVDLNPDKTYDSPYLTADYGSDRITLRYPGHADLTLDFAYDE